MKCPYERKHSDITYDCVIIEVVKRMLKYYEPWGEDDGLCIYDNKNKCPIYKELRREVK